MLSSAGAGHFSPVAKSTVAKKTMMNSFEVVSANPETGFEPDRVPRENVGPAPLI
jgi:hypothetical protein